VLSQKLNRDPLPEEVAAEAGLTEARVRQLLELVENPLSLQTPVGDGEHSLGELIEDEQVEKPEQGERPGFCVCMIRKGGSCPRRRFRTS
jgi:DNA-directed RNA polymerase sigma subunit (sigma70/sigma32)